MPKEILLYGDIYSYSTADIITQLEANKGDDITLRVNTRGGEVVQMYGIIAKFHEHTKGKKVKVDGRADSAGAILCCHADEVECLDVSTFTFHRASYGEWYERDPELFTDAMKASLTKLNNQARAAMESKFTAEEWKKATGVSLDDLFSLDGRINVTIDAKQAKKLGLVQKVTAITPKVKAEIEAMALAAFDVPEVPAAPTPEATTIPTTQNHKTMTIATLKQDHSEVYAQAVQEGIKAERERVKGFMAFSGVDPEGVAKAIKDGEELTMSVIAEYSQKAASKNALTTLKNDSADAVTTTEEGATETADAKALADFNEAWKKNLKANAS